MVGPMAGTCEHGTEYFGFVRSGEFEHKSDYRRRKELWNKSYLKIRSHSDHFSQQNV
jgi:hypothetical protein